MQEYKNDTLIVRYDPKTCIHAGECVRGLPSVFNVSKKAVDRCERRIISSDYRSGRVVPVRRAEL
jgi:uncharacterized Fe-S cluster protein YjdI